MTTAVADRPANGNSPPPANGLSVPKPEKLVVHDSGPAAYLFDTARFEHCYRIASAMAKASLIPDHLTTTGTGNNKKELPLDMIVGNCFMIVNQAIRWGMDPFALPSETYVVGNKLGFQGKLVAAVINARAGLKMPLATIYNSGKGDELAAVVFGSREQVPQEAWPLLKKYAKDEDGEVYTDLMCLGVLCIRISVGQAKTSNQMWTKDPAQKLYYSGATKWARRHAPEIILGVLTDDDIERMQALPGATGDGSAMRVETLDHLADKLAATAPMLNVVEGETQQADAPAETPDRPEDNPSTDANMIEEATQAASQITAELSIQVFLDEYLPKCGGDDERSIVQGLAADAKQRIVEAREARNKAGKK